MYHVAVQQRPRRRGARIACATAAALLALQVRATPAGAAGPEKADAPAANPADASAVAPTPSAQQLADRAFELHAGGNYAAAIAMYLKAYDASDAAVILLNIATIYDRKLHERELAAEYYRRYLGAPDAEPDLVERATERLTALKQAEDAGAAPPRGPTQGSSTPAAPPDALDVGAASRRVRTAGFTLGAIGVVTLGASLTLALLAKSKDDDANVVCNGAVCGSSAGVDLARQAGTFASASTVTFLAGLGLAGGGLAMIILAPRDSAAPSSRLALSIRTSPILGAAGLDLCGAF
jgi:hypothetical protein